MIPGTIRAEQVRITIAIDDSACPPWSRDFDFEGTEDALRREILKDANESGVRYSYTALMDINESSLWQVWRLL